MRQLESRILGSAGLAHDEDVAVAGGDHRAIVVVEIEVAAAAEVLERVGARAARRQVHLGEDLQRFRVEHREDGPVEADANGHEAPQAIERDRGALAREQGRGRGEAVS